jgi:hypothetical protein
VDFDSIDLTDELTRVPRFLLVVAEADCVHAYYISDQAKICQTSLSLVGKTIVSVSVSNPSKNKMVFAVATAFFDHSQIQMQTLTLKDDKVLKFGAPNGDVKYAHDYPVGRARLSKNLPRYMVTCGEGIDL